MKYKIIADSSCDITPFELNALKDKQIELCSVPLTVFIDERTYVDNGKTNVTRMLERLSEPNKKCTSSCPSQGDYLSLLQGADKYFIVTISAKLSGSYNAAFLARKMAEKEGDVCVIDSMATSGCGELIVNRLLELIVDGKSYEEICEDIVKYRNEELELVFMLEKFDNLIRNGRVGKIEGAIAKGLNIKLVCRAFEGEISLSHKALGTKRATSWSIEYIDKLKKEKDVPSGSCIIGHAGDPVRAEEIKNRLTEKNIFKNIVVKHLGVLNSFYALEGGIIISFEK